MKKRRKHNQTWTVVILSTLALFVLYLTTQTSITGYIVYESQQTDINDTYLREGSDSNFGSSVKMQIGKSVTNLQLNSLIKFNLSTINSSNTVLNATLQIYVSYSSSNNTISISAYPLTSDWNEFEAGWNNRMTGTPWNVAGGDYSDEINSTTLNSTGWYNLTITSTVRNWVKNTNPNYGIILVATSASSGDFKEISSSSAADQSLIPKLTVNYVENDPPRIINVTTDSTISTPKNVGESITFNIDWSDLEEDASEIFVCNSSNITSSGCTGRTFCSIGSTTTSPTSCQYTILPQDNRTTRYFVGACSGTSCSQIYNSTFYMNHQPSINLTIPNGGETINQSLGNYLIKFNTTDRDSDQMTANLYYGLTKNSTTNLITTINLTERCNPTTKVCNYSWDSTGIYGEYFLTIIVNDTFSTSLASSNTSFSVRSILDTEPPSITSQNIDAYIYSGKNTTVSTIIVEANPNTVWAVINETSQIISMRNTTEFGDYSGYFIAGQIGKYHFKIYANDTVGNLNDTMPWQEFNITKPLANTSNELSPSISLPFSVIKISGEINTSDSLVNSHAFLNVPEGFSFISGHPQNSDLGNFTGTKQAIWYVSTPLTESNYTFNITYSDGYSNSWTSSNFSTEVSSVIGGGTTIIGGTTPYLLSISGYPEVETSHPYYVESSLTQDSTYVNADSIQITIYDSLGNLVSGPSSMTQKSIGVYNYSYAVGPSVNEGLWQTIVNASKNGTNYYANQFWKVVGGPFDVRNITILDSSQNNLTISVTTENTGGANKDLILVWNITREDTDEELISESETFMVNANSIRIWTVRPSVNYIGQVKISFVGYYSGTEKAGAFKIFSITAPTNGTQPQITPPSAGGAGGGGGGGGGAPATTTKPDLTAKYEQNINLTKNIEKIVLFEITNTGDLTLTNLNLTINNLDPSQYIIAPIKLDSLKPNSSAQFKIKFMITTLSTNLNIDYQVNSKEIKKNYPAIITMISLKDFFMGELMRLLRESEQLKINAKEDIVSEIQTCDEFIKLLNSNIQSEEFINARENLKNADACLNKIRDKINRVANIPFTEIKMADYIVWIITWTLIIILIIILTIVIYILNKKLRVLNFIKQAPTESTENTSLSKKSFDKKLEEIERKIGKID